MSTCKVFAFKVQIRMKGSYLFPRVKPLFFETKTLDFVEILAYKRHIVKILAIL